MQLYELIGAYTSMPNSLGLWKVRMPSSPGITVYSSDLQIPRDRCAEVRRSLTW